MGAQGGQRGHEGENGFVREDRDEQAHAQGVPAEHLGRGGVVWGRGGAVWGRGWAGSRRGWLVGPVSRRDGGVRAGTRALGSERTETLFLSPKPPSALTTQAISTAMKAALAEYRIQDK